MINKNKYLPFFYYDSVFNISYNFFLKKNIKVLCFDLDNTLLSSKENKLNPNVLNLLKKLSEDFQIFIISNTSLKKIQNIVQCHNLSFIYLNLYHKKPSIWGFKKLLELVKCSPNQIMMIGDQLRTDIASANKMNIISVLVKPLDRKNESFLTKLSRYWVEKPFIQKIKKNNLEEYKKKFQNFIK